MIVKTLTVGLLQTSCYVVADRMGGEVAIIDPGGDVPQIIDASRGFVVRYVINTHAHFDHIAGNGALLTALAEQQEIPPELLMHSRAAPLSETGGGASLFGFQMTPSPPADRLLSDGDVLALGQLSLKVLYTPGHSPGSISLYCASEGVLFVGDVLFRRGVGRADLPGGNWQTLLDSIKTRLFALPDETTVYPGHGPATTIGEERRGNPFLLHRSSI
jgi:glyoxylase-like metal-dependent hydrolase (beta-lactamase superfamily II)